MEREARRELAEFAPAASTASRLPLARHACLPDRRQRALADEAMAAILYPELEPFAGGNVMVGHLVACYGAADRYLGMLAATLGEAESAERHFEAALELNRRMGAPTWVAHTAFEYARLLLGRGARGRERAEALLGEARALAERIGMAGLLARIRPLGVVAAGGVLPGRALAARGADPPAWSPGG